MKVAFVTPLGKNISLHVALRNVTYAREHSLMLMLKLRTMEVLQHAWSWG